MKAFSIELGKEELLGIIWVSIEFRCRRHIDTRGNIGILLDDIKKKREKGKPRLEYFTEIIKDMRC